MTFAQSTCPCSKDAYKSRQFLLFRFPFAFPPYRKPEHANDGQPVFLNHPLSRHEPQYLFPFVAGTNFYISEKLCLESQAIKLFHG